MERVYIYINKDEELGEIIDKVKKNKEKDIVLVVPEKLKSLSHPINFEIFKKEIESLTKNLVINTDDEKIKNFARQYGIPLFLDEKEEIIFDVKPPQKQEAEYSDEKEILKEKDYLIKETDNKLNIFKFFKKIFVLGFIFTAFAGFAILVKQFFETKAEISIEFQKIPIELADTVILSSEKIFVDEENKILPAEEENVELFQTITVTTTGKVLSNDQPLLKVEFLNYLNRNIPLVVGTRLSYNKNIFRTTDRIEIPSSYNNNPGRIESYVLPYDIKESNLSIKKNEELKIVAWEENKTKTEDGRLFSDFVKVVSLQDYSLSTNDQLRIVDPQDVTNAKILLEESLKSGISAKLAFNNQNKYFYIFDPSLVNIEITNFSNNIGDKVNQLSVSGKATYKTLKVDKKVFDNFVKSLLIKEYSDGKKRMTIESFYLEKVDILDFNAKKREMIVGVKAKAVLIPDISVENIKKDLTDKTIEQARNYFDNLEAKKVTIKIFPSWKNKLPKDVNKIKIFVK